MLDRLLASMLKPRGLVSLAASAMAITFMFALLSGVAEQTFPSYGSQAAIFGILICFAIGSIVRKPWS